MFGGLGPTMRRGDRMLDSDRAQRLAGPRPAPPSLREEIRRAACRALCRSCCGGEPLAESIDCDDRLIPNLRDKASCGVTDQTLQTAGGIEAAGSVSVV